MSSFAARALLASLCAHQAIFAVGLQAAELEEVIVSATRWREQSLIEVPGSVTVLSQRMLADSAQQHFEEVLTQIPNLNWAAGSSRPRYFQLRGIGEREQYEGAPNPSVGLLIDDIDFSGIGMAATLFDIESIEVLRGPQATRLGANALGGIIAVRSVDPLDETSARVLLEVGNYDTRAIGFAVNISADELNSAWRLSAQTHRSDGFRSNPYLRRADTNDRDELTARGKWRWQAGENHRLDVALMHVDLDNGYDAFSIDNSQRTLSDRPGKDSQRAQAAAAKWTSDLSTGTFTAIATTLDSRSVHAFDGDWGNSESWAPYTYDFFYRANRERRTATLEARFASHAEESIAWLVGAYALRLDEDIHEVSMGTLIDPDPVFGYVFELDEFLASDFEATNSALFAQIDGAFASRWAWSLGLRGEMRDQEYVDRGLWQGSAVRPPRSSAHDTMVGGNASLSYAVHDRARVYATVGRGYKAGGFNLGSAASGQPAFGPEFLWNYEIGVKGEWSARFGGDLTAFYQSRADTQVRTGRQLVAGDPNSFVFFTSNADQGRSYGLEASARWLPHPRFETGITLGLLRTGVSGLLDENQTVLPTRELPHAPKYQAQAHATWRSPRGLMLRIDAAAIDAFFFDTDHDQRSRSYRLVNVKAGYEAEHWRVYLYGRNVFDESYATRGFYFGNEPPAFDSKLYVQNGDPRQVGLSVELAVR